MAHSGARHRAIMAAIFAGNFSAILSATTIIIPLPYLMAAFQTDLATISWAVTAFSLATGVIAPATGYLTNRFGVRTLYLSALGCFLISSVLCALAWNVYSLILLRFLQGLCCGVIIPVTMTLIYSYVARSEQAFAFSMWSMSGVLAPATGPTIAGIILQYISWQWIFLMNVPMVLLAGYLTLRYMERQERTVQSLPRFDSIGLLLSMCATTLLLLGLNLSQQWGFTDPKILGLLIGGLLLLVAFVHHELHLEKPLLDMHVFHFKSFSICGFSNILITLILNCSIFLLPLYLQTVRGYTPLETGLIVLAGPISVAVISPIVGKLYRRPIAKHLMLVGVAGMLIGFLLLTQVGRIQAIPYIILAIVIMETGVGAAKIPGTNYGMEVLPSGLTAHGSAMISWMKQCATSLAVGLITSVILIRTRVHLNGVPASDTDAYRIAYEAGSIDIFTYATIGSILFFVIIFFLMRPKTDDIS